MYNFLSGVTNASLGTYFQWRMNPHYLLLLNELTCHWSSVKTWLSFICCFWSFNQICCQVNHQPLGGVVPLWHEFVGHTSRFDNKHIYISTSVLILTVLAKGRCWGHVSCMSEITQVLHFIGFNNLSTSAVVKTFSAWHCMLNHMVGRVLIWVCVTVGVGDGWLN